MDDIATEIATDIVIEGILYGNGLPDPPENDDAPNNEPIFADDQSAAVVKDRAVEKDPVEQSAVKENAAKNEAVEEDAIEDDGAEEAAVDGPGEYIDGGAVNEDDNLFRQLFEEELPDDNDASTNDGLINIARFDAPPFSRSKEGIDKHEDSTDPSNSFCTIPVNSQGPQSAPKTRSSSTSSKRSYHTATGPDSDSDSDSDSPSTARNGRPQKRHRSQDIDATDLSSASPNATQQTLGVGSSRQSSTSSQRQRRRSSSREVHEETKTTIEVPSRPQQVPLFGAPAQFYNTLRSQPRTPRSGIGFGPSVQSFTSSTSNFGSSTSAFALGRPAFASVASPFASFATSGASHDDVASNVSARGDSKRLQEDSLYTMPLAPLVSGSTPRIQYSFSGYRRSYDSPDGPSLGNDEVSAERYGQRHTRRRLESQSVSNSPPIRNETSAPPPQNAAQQARQTVRRIQSSTSPQISRRSTPERVQAPANHAHQVPAFGVPSQPEIHHRLASGSSLLRQDGFEESARAFSSLQRVDTPFLIASMADPVDIESDTKAVQHNEADDDVGEGVSEAGSATFLETAKDLGAQEQLDATAQLASRSSLNGLDLIPSFPTSRSLPGSASSSPPGSPRYRIVYTTSSILSGRALNPRPDHNLAPSPSITPARSLTPSGPPSPNTLQRCESIIQESHRAVEALPEDFWDPANFDTL